MNGGGGGSYLASNAANQTLSVGNTGNGVVYIYLADTPCTWTGGAGNGSWTVPENWNYPPLPGYLVYFAGSNETAVDTVTNQSVGGIVFAAEAAAFTISNNTITLAGNVINQGTSTQTINSGLDLAMNTTFVAYAGNLDFGGPISFGSNATFLTVNGAEDTYISGNISGNGGLMKSGNGTLTLSGTNNFTGNTTIGGGDLIIQGGFALPNSATGTLNSANATFTIGDSETIGSLQGVGTTAIAYGQTLTIAQTGNATYSGPIVGAGALELTGNGTRGIALSPEARCCKQAPLCSPESMRPVLVTSGDLPLQAPRSYK
jgi:autotransporter-associated beta strand protein